MLSYILSIENVHSFSLGMRNDIMEERRVTVNKSNEKNFAIFKYVGLYVFEYVCVCICMYVCVTVI